MKHPSSSSSPSNIRSKTKPALKPKAKIQPKCQTRALQWPRPYESGRDQLYRETARLQALKDNTP